MNPTIDERKGCTSASNAEADGRCPGRFLAQRGLPELEGEFAESGRAIHAALAVRDPSHLRLEQRETYDRCLDIEAKKVAEFFGDAPVKNWRENPKDPEASRFWVRFSARKIPFEHSHSCRPDTFYWVPGQRMLIVEYKTLRGDVRASSRNQQLRDQQVILRGHYIIPGPIGVVVIQPEVELNPQICVYSAEDSDKARVEMFQRISASQDPNAPRVPGELQCQWCRAKRHCTEYQQWAGQLTPPSVLAVLEVPMVAWTPQQRASAALALKPAMDFLEDVKAFLKEGLEKDPAFVPGWTLQPGNKRETITNPQQCFERFSAMGGKLEEFMTCISVGKAKLREAVSGVTGARGKALDSAIASVTQGIVEVTRNAPSLKKVEGQE